MENGVINYLFSTYIGRGVCNFSEAPESKLSAGYYSGSESLRGRQEAEQAWPFFGHTAHWSLYRTVPGVFLSSSSAQLVWSDVPLVGLSSEKATCVPHTSTHVA